MPEDADLIVRELRRSGLSLETRRVDSAADYEHALAGFAPDLILSDYTLPGFDGSEALRIAQRQRPDTPFIFVSGTIGEERAIEALKQGAVDYVLKDNRARLAPAVERALKEAQERESKRWAMRKLEESEERFRFAMHYSSIGMALVDPNGRWLGVNPALCKILGYDESELLSRDALSITHPEDRFADGPQIRQVLLRQVEAYRTNKRFVRKDGAVVWTEIAGSLVWQHSGKPHYFIWQIQDITDRIRAEEALRASEERFRSIAEATQEWIWEIDAQGVYTFCSPAVESILGYAPASLLGRNSLDIVGGDSRQSVADLLGRGLIEKTGWRDLTFDFSHAAGGVRGLENNALPLLDEFGPCVRLAGRGTGHHAAALPGGSDRPAEQNSIGAERHQLDHRARPRPPRAVPRVLPDRRTAGWLPHGVGGHGGAGHDACRAAGAGRLGRRLPRPHGSRARRQGARIRARWGRRSCTRKWSSRTTSRPTPT